MYIADLAPSKVERLLRDNSNAYCPMWVAGKVWLLSDREGAPTIFSYDLQSKKVSRALENRGLDCKSASASGAAIVLEQFGGLSILDPKTGKATRLKVSMASDLAEVREKVL